MKLYHYLTSYTKINSKWIKDLNARAETIKLLKENLRGRLLDLDLGEDILDLTPKQRQQRQK